MTPPPTEAPARLLVRAPFAKAYEYDQHGPAMWKVFRYWLRTDEVATGVDAYEAIKAFLATGHPYLLPFVFSGYDARNFAGDLREIGMEVWVLPMTEPLPGL